uniref:LLM class flavin-dependent oxidoreductase n=1 Tax=Microbacterium sp. B19 TaxID=96765 RepID=UPI0005630F5A
EHYRLDAAPALPKPVQSPVPVIVGGGGPKRTPALAARFATEFNIGFVPEDVVAEKFAVVRAACEDIGRDPASLKFSVYGSRQVQAGDTVAAGQLIGLVGSTGSSTANHLHFEVHINGSVVDPYAWLQQNAG